MSDMIERTSFDTPTLPRLVTIIGEVQRGVYQVPQFQRPSVWGAEQRLDLLDSIVKGLPIGSLLVWRSGVHTLETYDEVAGIRVPKSPPGLDKRTYLIDGHQRISTLFGALVKPSQARQGPDATRWPIYCDLGSKERPAFRLPPPAGKDLPRFWLPLEILFDERKMYAFRDQLFRAGEDERAEEATRLANVFKDYIMPVVPLVTESLDLVTDAFVRINSKGSDMTEAHMLRALTYQKPKIDTDTGFKNARDALGSLGFGAVPDQALVNSLKAILGLDVYRASVTSLNDQLKTNPGALATLQQALVEAAAFLQTIGVCGWGALPYAYQFVTLAALAARAPASLEARRVALERWFWRTTYAEHYTGQTGGQIRRDIDALAESAPNGDDRVAFGAEVRGLNSPIRQNTVRMKAHLLFLATRPKSTDARRRRQDALADSLAGEPGRRGFPRLVAGEIPAPGNLLAARKDEAKSLVEHIGRGEVTQSMADEYQLPIALVGVPTRLDHDLIVSRAAEIREAERLFVKELGLRLSDLVEEGPAAGDDDDD